MKILRRLFPLALLASTIGPNEAKVGSFQGTRERLRALDSSAEQAAGLDRRKLEAYASLLLGNSSFGGAGAAVRKRCIRAELAYRRRLRPPVTEAQLVSAFNGLGRAISIANFRPTDEAQLRAFRLQCLRFIPHIVKVTDEGSDNSLTENMTPLAAVYIASNLLNQEAHNPFYQLGPASWAPSYEEKIKSGIAEGQSILVASSSPKFAAPFQRFQAEISNRSSASAKQLAQFMDQLGFPND